MLLGNDVHGQLCVSPHHRVGGVAEELPKRLKVAAVAEELAGEGAAEIVGGYAASPDSSLPSARLNNLVDALAADGSAVPRGKLIR